MFDDVTECESDLDRVYRMEAEQSDTQIIKIWDNKITYILIHILPSP